MKDFRGTEINVDDTVVYYYRTSTSGGYMREAKVVGVCKRSGYDCVKIVPISDNSRYNEWYMKYPVVKASHKIIKI